MVERNVESVNSAYITEDKIAIYKFAWCDNQLSGCHVVHEIRQHVSSNNSAGAALTSHIAVPYSAARAAQILPTPPAMYNMNRHSQDIVLKKSAFNSCLGTRGLIRSFHIRIEMYKRWDDRRSESENSVHYRDFDRFHPFYEYGPVWCPFSGFKSRVPQI